MKYLLLILFITSTAGASMEHRKGQGEVPDQKKLSTSRSCFKEIQDLGCPHPKDDREAFTNCLSLKREELSEGCGSFFDKLYGKRK